MLVGANSLLYAAPEEVTDSSADYKKINHDKIARIALEYSKNIVMEDDKVFICEYYNNTLAELLQHKSNTDKFALSIPLGVLSVYAINEFWRAVTAPREPFSWSRLIQAESALFLAVASALVSSAYFISLAGKATNRWEKRIWAIFDYNQLTLAFKDEALLWSSIDSIEVKELPSAIRATDKEIAPALYINKKDGSSFFLSQKDIPIGIHLLADIIEVYLELGAA